MCDLQEEILKLFHSEPSLALRFWGVAKRLGTDPQATLGGLNKLKHSGLLFKQRGYYHLDNLRDMKELFAVRHIGALTRLSENMEGR